MRETATLLQGFHYHSPEYRPFDELEVPGVSLLVASAAAAGYYPIAEYKIRKIDKVDRRKRCDGRADLWFIVGNESYSFETKRAWNVSSDAGMRRRIRDAVADATCIPPDESDYSFGIVIAPVFNEECVERYSNISGPDYIFSIDLHENPQVFFFFKKRAN